MALLAGLYLVLGPAIRVRRGGAELSTYERTVVSRSVCGMKNEAGTAASKLQKLSHFCWTAPVRRTPKQRLAQSWRGRSQPPRTWLGLGCEHLDPGRPPSPKGAIRHEFVCLGHIPEPRHAHARR